MGADEIMINGAARFLSNVPIPWVKHEAKNAGDPCIMQLISTMGFEGYGRFWRLVELLSNNPLHTIPLRNEQGYKSYLLGLGFTEPEPFETFISTLIDLDLVTVDEQGRRLIPLVESAALSVGMSRYNGRKGGKMAAANRKQKQV